MPLTTEQTDKLSIEQIIGGKAQRAYNEFIKDFCDDKRKSLFVAFSNLPLTDTENLMEVKRMLYAVDTLETEIMTVIETGKMASITLNEQEVKH